MKSIQRFDFIQAGVVSKTHGHQGEVRLVFQSKIKLDKWAFLECRGKPVPFYIVQKEQVLPNEYIVQLKGINHLEDAKSITGFTVLVPKPKRKTGIKEQAILNYTVADIHAGIIGKVKAVQEIATQTMLFIEQSDDEIMIPLVDAYISKVDEEKEIIYMDLPEGLLDLNQL
ncbi:MAG: ribosome maturation factor RimM [Bacteroidia bacterium]|nr:ribosome maturation factor RimM [Bacteroidia bacterium]